MWAPLFGDIHASQRFQATDDRQRDVGGELVDRVQQSVDAKPQLAVIASGFDVDIAGALVEGVLQKPVDDGDNMGFFIVAPGRVAVSRVDRPCKLAERLAELADLRGAGQDALDRAAQHLAKIHLPGPHEGLRAGHRDAVGIDSDGQYCVASGKGGRHQLSRRAQVKLQGVYIQIGLAGALCQPLAQGVEVKALAGPAWVGQMLAGDRFERVFILGQSLSGQ
ncbi:hypothetical protein D3C80_1388940 [compost metagenome]